MREILFRGVSTDSAEWVEGWFEMYPFARWPLKEAIIPAQKAKDGHFYHVEVIPETVGQFTGLTDKNGKKIFEGDIFHMEDEIVAVVIFKDGCFRLEEYGLSGAYTESGFDECGGGWGVINCDPIDWYFVKDMEVIGNIHDNPELLEVE